MWKPPDDQGKVPAGRQQRCVTGSRLLLLERMRWKVSSPLVELPSLPCCPTRWHSHSLAYNDPGSERGRAESPSSLLTFQQHSRRTRSSIRESNTDSGTRSRKTLHCHRWLFSVHELSQHLRDSPNIINGNSMTEAGRRWCYKFLSLIWHFAINHEQ